jgi:type 1 fimbria pilin
MIAINFLFKQIPNHSLPIIATLIISLLWGVPTTAYANYNLMCVQRSNISAKPGHIIITTEDPINYPVGTLVGEPYKDSGVVFTFTGVECSGTGSSTWAMNYDNGPVGTYASPEGVLPVYNLTTNSQVIDGFGYAMSIADSNQPYQPLEGFPTKPLWAVNHMVYEGGLGVRFNLYIVTTAPLTPGDHVIPFLSLASICLSSSETNNDADYCAGIDLSPFVITVNTPSCDIDAETPAIVNLERINASELTHKGDVGKNVDFSISLKCNKTATVNMTLTDPNGGDRENGVLYNDSGDGMAQNVGVQLLSVKDGGQTPQTIRLDESFTVGNATEGHYEIPMTARYYRTSEDTVEGGKVSASVIYELSYQ